MNYTENDVDQNDNKLPKLNRFTKELTNWLSLAAIGMFLIYGVLHIVYEVALDLTHVRWAFTGFLIACAIDVISYWICRFAVSDTTTKEIFLVYLVIILQSLTGLFYLIAPIVVVLTYHFTPEVSMLPGEKTLPESEDKLVHTLEEHVNPRPCTDDNQHWQCGYISSVKIAAWCMWIVMIPKILVMYLLIRILIGSKKAKYSRVTDES